MDVLRALGAEIVRTPTEAKFDSPGMDTVVFLEATKVNNSSSTKLQIQTRVHSYKHTHSLGHVTTVYIVLDAYRTPHPPLSQLINPNINLLTK